MVGGEVVGCDGNRCCVAWYWDMSSIQPEVEQIAGFLVSCCALAQFPGHLCQYFV